MIGSEKFFFSISFDKRGVHVLLWDDKHDLVRALLVLAATLKDVEINSLIVSERDSDLLSLQKSSDDRRRGISQEELGESENSIQEKGSAPTLAFLVLFFQQASMGTVGAFLNGLRNPLSETPGSLLVIRAADFARFSHAAPDLASFVGPKVLDASSMISDFSPEIVSSLTSSLPDDWGAAINKLPGEPPTQQELDAWLALCAPITE